MSPEFAAAVDPIFMYVSSVVDEIEANKNPNAEDVNTKIRGLLDNAENMLGRRADWELAKYALVAWVDDLLIEAAWDGSRWWEQNRLEFQIFNTTSAFSKFYEQSQKATELPQKDALEVFTFASSWGFGGYTEIPKRPRSINTLGFRRRLMNGPVEPA